MAWSAPVLPQPAEVVIPSIVEKIELPETLGTIRERYIPEMTRKGFSDAQQAPVIVHIQDAHSNYEAQTNTKKILKHLTAEYGFKHLFMEGGIGEVNAGLLRYFDDPEINRKTADLLARDGIVSGMELFLLETAEAHPLSGKIKAHGVEDAGLFKENLRSFRLVMKKKAQTDRFIDSLKSIILSEASRHFNKKLRDFFHHWLFYADRHEILLSHLEVLGRYAGKELDIDFLNPRLQLDWPQLVRYFKLRDLEKRLDDEKVAEEKAGLLDWMRENNIEGDFRKDFELLGTANLKIEAPRDFFEGFYNAASPKGFTFEKYPALTRQAAYLILESELDSAILFHEITRLTDAILGHLTRTREEKALLSLYQDSLLLKKLFSLELLRDEFELLGREGGRFRPSALVRRFKEAGFTLKICPEPSKHCGESFDRLFSRAIQFYRIAEKREQVIFKKMIDRMKEEKTATSILVTGGFHSEGLMRQFRDNGIAYVEIMPRISEVGDHSTYHDVMNLKGNFLTLHSHVPFARLTSPPLKANIFENPVDDYLAGKVITKVSESIRIGGSSVKDGTYFENAFNALNQSEGFKEGGLYLQPISGNRRVLMLENDAERARPVMYGGGVLGTSGEGQLITLDESAFRSEVRNDQAVIQAIEDWLKKNPKYDIPALLVATMRNWLHEVTQIEEAETIPLIKPFETQRSAAAAVEAIRSGFMQEVQGFEANNVRLLKLLLEHFNNRTPFRSELRNKKTEEVIQSIEKMLGKNQIYNVPRLVAIAIEELIIDAEKEESAKEESAIPLTITRPLIPPQFDTPRKIGEGIRILQEGLKKIKGFNAQDIDLLKALLEHYKNKSESAKSRAEIRAGFLKKFTWTAIGASLIGTLALSFALLQNPGEVGNQDRPSFSELAKQELKYPVSEEKGSQKAPEKAPESAQEKQPEQVSEKAAYRFAHQYQLKDLIEHKEAADKYVLDLIYWEGKFHQPGIGYNAHSGLTYDGHAINPVTGELQGGPRNWSASSKESLHV
ncbi:MAG TPA: hypothetical protein VD913_00230, partial [bacterium]|nr:hypothetical protein [bacterium]